MRTRHSPALVASLTAAIAVMILGTPAKTCASVEAPPAVTSHEGDQDPTTVQTAVQSTDAVDREFWSFRPPTAQERPAVRDRDWPQQRLDYFILGRLEARGLTPSPQADRRTLIRRVTMDLTGLPPSPEEVRGFTTDSSPDAYRQLIDRLIASPLFGERLASLWLPLARYAEDQAHQVGSDTTMFYPNAYRYREWIINAFNHDLPYNDFIRLQLAADKYEDNQDQLAALGFLGLGPKYYNRNRLEVKADEWEDRVDTVTRTVLGLTVACARCHDHRFDPIPTEDYYSLAGVFASTRMVNRAPAGTNVSNKVSADKMPPGTLHIVEDGDVEDLHVFIRGNVTRPGPLAKRHFLHALSSGTPTQFTEGSGRRELADLLVSEDNPLAARVMVNRLWDMCFGAPLVPTPSDFGHSGSKPSHPELLDDLAVRFMENGWSIQSLVREFVLSATYQQDSRLREDAAEIDAGNEGFWRMNRRRLSIEQWRDTVLLLAGNLDRQGGPSMELTDPDNHRRTVYGRISRLKLDDLLMLFDYPDANVHAEKRSVTTTATQKLFQLNSPFMLRQASAFAARLTANPNESDEARLYHAHELTFGRPPEPIELNLAMDFLQGTPAPDMTRWEQYAHVLLVSNELLYVD